MNTINQSINISTHPSAAVCECLLSLLDDCTNEPTLRVFHLNLASV